MLFSASVCSIFYLPIEKGPHGRSAPDSPGFLLIVVLIFEIYVEDRKTAVRRLPLNAVCSKLINSAALAGPVGSE
jgi:hypothetical protein